MASRALVAIVGVAGCAAPASAPPDANGIAWSMNAVGQAGVQRGDAVSRSS
jgi:hypothetical protein